MTIQMRIPGGLLLIIVASCGGGSDRTTDFTPAQALLPTEHFNGIVVADFNGDGFNDIAVGSSITDDRQVTDSRISIYAQDTGLPGTFDAPVHFPYAGGEAFARQLVTDDFDADGLPDIVASGWSEGGFRVFMNDAAQPGYLLPPVYHPHGQPDTTFGRSLATGDVDADGFADVVTVDEEFVTWFRQDSNNFGNFLGGITVGPGSDDVALGDINADGLPDIIVLEGKGSLAEAILVYLNNGNVAGTFLALTSLSTDFFAGSIDLADCNADGVVDIAVAGAKPTDSYSSRGKFVVFYQSPLLQFSASSVTNTPGSGITDIFETAFLDDDAYPEIVFQISKTSPRETILHIEEMTAAGVPVTRLNLVLPSDESNYSTGLHGFAIGDLNSDGLEDIAVLHQGINVYFRMPGPQLAFEEPLRINEPL